MCKRFINLLTSAALSLAASPVLSEQTDFQQPIQVKAESQFLDGKNKLSVLVDNVQIIQGSLTILADRVEVEASAGKGKEVFIASGSPAVYTQTLDDGRLVEAKALEIRYEVINRTIALSGQAELVQNNSAVKGDSIVYNMDKEQLMAKGSGSNDGDGRVIAVFSTEVLDSIKQSESPKAQKPQTEEQDTPN